MIKRIIYIILDIIDFFTNFYTDEPTDLEKIKEIHHIDLMVETERGFERAMELNLTNPYYNYIIKTDNKKKLSASKGHVIVREGYIYDYIENLKMGDKIITKDGVEEIVKVKKTRIKSNMVDLSMDNIDNLYYTNDILSHNTISTSIYILWFVTFHDDKGVMIVANKSKTSIEIMDKIKSIYKYLPYFLKKGVVNWTQKKIAFDNGCRVQTESRSKEPAIGFTVDLLYFDEFAHIPDNIVVPYYRAAIPTISSIKESKVIITSTPKGFNLFHDIWQSANKDEYDLDKGPYTPLKILWWQKEGRRDTWLFPNKRNLERYKIKEDKIFRWLKSEGYELYKDIEDGKEQTKIKFDMENEEKTSIDYIRKLRYQTIPFPELFIITNWKEVNTKLIGGEDNFKQEFEVRFMTGDKSLFDDVQMEKLSKSKFEFKNIRIPYFDKKLNVNYEGLTWIDDPNIFNIRNAKDYYITAGIDFSEGLGKDYTVMTIFKIKLKDFKTIKKHRHTFTSIYEYFQIEEIGQFRSNLLSIKEFSQIFYLVCFELFDPEKVKVLFEYNVFGGEFLAHLPNIFEMENNYSNSIFARTKHNAESKVSKIGIKVNQNKKTLIKNYQNAFKKQSILVHNHNTIKEMETFTRHDTPSGDYTYRSESGNDDSVMSVVHVCNLLDNISFRNLVDLYIQNELTEKERMFIEGVVIEENEILANSYNSIVGSRRKLQNNFRTTPNNFKNIPLNNFNRF